MALDRYIRDDDGFRKYLELLEGTPTQKRQALLENARAENPVFAAEAEKYLITFEKICRLPELELTEVLGSLKPEHLAVGIASAEDAGLKEKLVTMVPRDLAPAVGRLLKENPTPKPYDVGGARLKWILAARGLEKSGKLKSIHVPQFGFGFFRKQR